MERVEVFINKKDGRDIDPRFLSWKGASMMSLLEITEEFWITKLEWEQLDTRSIKEKAPFLWNYFYSS